MHVARSPSPFRRPACRTPVLWRVVVGLAMWVALFGLPTARAQQQPAPAPPETIAPATVMETVERLKPGQFLWAPEAAPEGPLLLVVSLATQRAVLYRNGVPIAVSTVSTGRPGYRTPTGVFTVLEKHVVHFSSLYDDAPMPYMQRLTWGGVALHGGQLPGYPASHGCIRLPHEFARLLYGATHLGMTVIVTPQLALPRIAPVAGLPLGQAKDLAPADGSEWHPERAPEGPVSIVVSGADRRIVVLRNGQVIGSAPITLRKPIVGTSAYIRQAAGTAGAEWVSVGLLGQGDPPAPDRQDIGIDPAFRAAVSEILAPGTTVVLTADAVTANPNANPGPLIDSE